LSTLVLLVAATGAHAQSAPANDNWVGRTSITLPFNTNEPNMYLATVEPSDPEPPCLPVLGGVTTSAGYTLWYSYTTGLAAEYVTLAIAKDKPASSIVSVYTGNPTDGFHIISGGCGAQSQSLDDATTRVAGLRLAANTSYSIEVAVYSGTLSSSSNDVLEFSVDSAHQYVVTKPADTNDGTCDSDCSLREAIGASNADPGAVLIPAGTYKLTIAGAEEYLNATGSLDALHGMGIYGAGMQQTIIDANQLDRAFFLDPAPSSGSRTSFAIGDLTITNGSSTFSNTHVQGGGGLTLESNSDYLGMERVAVTSNHAAKTGGGLTIDSPATLRDCVVSNNTSDYAGGGGLNISTSDGRYVEISGSTISGNSIADQAGGAGGGISVYGTLYVSNSTISGNHAIGYGGGIYAYGSGGSLHMASSTVVLNSAQTNPYRQDAGAGVSMNGTAPNSIINSIIAYNTAADLIDPPDCGLFDNTIILTSSYNLVGSSGGSSPGACAFDGTGDVTNASPGVSQTLANNGGPTQTHALLVGSPAIDAGDPAGCKDNVGALLTTDQRGFTRPDGAHCDVGAYEWHDDIFRNGFEP
jgi:CSLREA domain-containing protein